MAKNYFGITDTGRVRSNNEDTFIAEQVMNNQFIAACVIDGVGGYSGGEIAAKLAHDAVLNNLHNTEDLQQTMKQALAAANESIYHEKQTNKNNEQMACVLTLALVDVENNKFYYAHVGDTRLYLFRDNSLVKVTRDHSFVGFLEDSGRLTEEAAMRHPKRNEINKALGFDAQMSHQTDYIEMGESPFLAGDILLLCSDGLSDMIDNSTMTSILSSDKNLQAKAKALVQAANDAGGKDNITVVLVHNDKVRAVHEATRPVAAAKKQNEPKAANAVEVGELTPVIVAEKAPAKRSNTVSVLTVLLIILLLAFLWMLYKNFFDERSTPPPPTTTSIIEKNQQELLLADSINNNVSNEVFIINVANGQPIRITEPISIQRDSLHIIGNGVSLVSDSLSKNVAFMVAANCRYVLFDSLTFENFDVAVIANSPAVHFKNVQFKNCRIPVQYQMLLPEGTPVNGRFADTLFINADTLK